MTEKHPEQLDAALAADAAPDAVPPPPADLVDRTVAALVASADAAAPGVRTAGGRRTWLVVAALAAGVALGSPTWALLRSRADGFSAGARQVDAQQTIQLGQRAVLVAEAGALLRWRPADGGVAVEQPAGEVFYRVNSGPFVVRTPAGVVRVTGTCFRVEVSDMKLINRQNLSGAAVGAALGAAVVVTVYEGRVLLASDQQSGEVELRPGQIGEMGSGGVKRVSAGDPAAVRPALAARPGIPRFDETEALRARIAEQDKELAQLRDANPVAKKVSSVKTQFLNPGREELLARAERCELAYDTPSINGFSDKDVDKMGLNPGEREVMNEVMKETKDQVIGELRRLYVEMSGDAATAERLSPQAMETEIFARAPEGGRTQARQQLARERAGLASPPADLARTPVAERTIRLMSSIGSLYEQKLAERLGPHRARQLRSLEDGWSGKTVTNGCK